MMNEKKNVFLSAKQESETVFESELSDQDRFLIELLVDGELDEMERKTLLRRLDSVRGGWRCCALTFLEFQTFAQSFRDPSFSRSFLNSDLNSDLSNNLSSLSGLSGQISFSGNVVKKDSENLNEKVSKNISENVEFANGNSFNNNQGNNNLANNNLANNNLAKGNFENGGSEEINFEKKPSAKDYLENGEFENRNFDNEILSNGILDNEILDNEILSNEILGSGIPENDEIRNDELEDEQNQNEEDAEIADIDADIDIEDNDAEPDVIPMYQHRRWMSKRPRVQSETLLETSQPVFGTASAVGKKKRLGRGVAPWKTLVAATAGGFLTALVLVGFLILLINPAVLNPFEGEKNQPSIATQEFLTSEKSETFVQQNAKETLVKDGGTAESSDLQPSFRQEFSQQLADDLYQRFIGVQGVGLQNQPLVAGTDEPEISGKTRSKNDNFRFVTFKRSQNDPEIKIPCIENDQLDAASYVAERNEISRNYAEKLNASGQAVETVSEDLVFPLKDGRVLIVPVETIRVQSLPPVYYH